MPRVAPHPSPFSPGAPPDWVLIVVIALNLTLYLASNLMSVRLLSLGRFGTCDAGTLTFPLVFMLGDVLTEIWGLGTARRVIWLTFFCNLLLLAATSAVTFWPAPACQPTEIVLAYRRVFVTVPCIILASLAAFLAGELTNAEMMVRIGLWTQGRHLWMRTIGSSIPGYLLDSAIFSFIAFGGTIPATAIGTIAALQFVGKMLMEILFSTPLAYGAIAWLKRHYAPPPSPRQ